VSLTDENKPGGRRDGLYSCEFVLSKGYRRKTHSELARFAIGIQEYFDRRVPSPSLDEVSKTSKISVHETRVGVFHLQEGAEHYQHHDNEETEGEKRVL